jgi:CubicO group peptidase (beta-lactamase class C family)
MLVKSCGIARLALCAFISILTTPALAMDVTRMEQVVQARAVDDQFMGAVLVAQGDDILLDKAYGAANLEWDIPNTPSTRFRIGSLGKQFTAAAILLLEEQGKLKLHDQVRCYLPDMPASRDKITLFNLLTQTSGIHDFTDMPDFGTTMKLKKTREERIATIRDKPLEFAPGEKFSYSNSNYILLGAVIENVSGVPYAKFVQDNIFMPLGMKDSGYESDAVLPRRASGYARADGAIIHASYIDMSAVTAAGAFYSTTHDLLIWERALLGGKLLSQASLKMMTKPFKDAWGPGAPFKGGYGMGLYVGTTLDGRREISHTGDIPGFVSMMATYPDDKLSVIVLSNIQGAPVGNIASNVADVALGKTVILPSERNEITLDAKILGRYVGNYQLRPDLVLAIIQDQGALYVQVGDRPRIPVFAQSETSFFAKSRDAQLDFEGKGSHASAPLWQINGDTVRAPRLP